MQNYLNCGRTGLVVLFLLAWTRLFAASPPSTDWNVAVIDHILASVPAGQQFAQVGDMEISVSYLQNWRNHLAGGPQPNIAFSGTFTPWPGGDVYYTFSNNVSAVKQKAFLDGAAEWAMFANLHFIPRTTQPNYVTVYELAALEGGQSMVGMVGGQQFIQISPTAWNRSTICHELGHTLGLVHEQQRSDRDSYVKILTNNITPGLEGNFVILTDSQNKSSYDFLSVMHYSRNAFSTDPSLDTIEPLPAYAKYINLMGQQFDPVLSVADRAGMAEVYGAGSAITNIVTNSLDNGPGSLRAALYYAFDHPGTTISFNIPMSDAGFSNNVFNILPSDGFPSLVHATILDGSTEPVHANPNGPQILFNGILGQSLSIYPSGLQFKGTNCVARSFIINNFPEAGVLITGSNAVGNTVSGCYLGTDATGTLAAPNVYYPIEIDDGAVSNVVGGTTATARNIISGSLYQGLFIHDFGTRNNVVEGNYIGLNANGNAALPNAWAGIEIYDGAQSNLIGGYTAAARNVISGNLLQGVAISTNTSGNIVAGNYIGLDPTGTVAIGNGYSGVNIFNGSSGNVIGGTASGAGNVISGNNDQGVLFQDPGTRNNFAQGNIIGLNAAGTAAIPNGFSGVGIFSGAQSNLIGGTVASARNVISGNAEQGVVIGNAGTRGNLVEGNYIGLNPTGTAAIGNAWAGLNFFDTADSNIAGGSAPGAGNVISGNGNQGVLFQDAGTQNNFVQGNIIGLNAAGNAAISNALSGIEIYDGPSANFIGGYGGARNFISGNGNYGILIDFSSSGNIVQGNTIGLDAANRAAIPNDYAAVVLYSGTTSNLIGGVTPGAANLISGSTADGVQVLFAGTTNNTIRGNSIFNSVGNGILLYQGGNNNLAAPALSSAAVTTDTTVTGSYNGTSGATYQLDFYADAPPAFSAEAMTYLGSTTITGTGGSTSFNANLGTRLPLGRAVTATATDPAGNTSQLSTGIAATMTSSVHDGIPDAWRALYFGGSGTTTNSSSAAAADPDHDGASNYEEFLAGTNPTNAASVFELTALNPNVSTNAVSFNSANGTIYRVQSSDDLAAGAWSILADQIIGTGANIFLTDPGAATRPHRFYRAEVLW
ncbi:MAG TPA: M12 family metallopeptidase [Verrucomicrobiae bacterium]